MLVRSPLPFASAALQRALIKAKHAWNEPRGPMHLCTKYWTDVFVRMYEDMPGGNDDPRWDQLLRYGMPLLRKIEGRQIAQERRR